MPEVKYLETLISAAQIEDKVTELARQIDRDYQGKDTVFLGILKGSYVFMADLARKVHLDRLEMNFMQVSSYENATSSSGNINIKLDLENDISGKHVLIVEDIVTTGGSIKEVIEVVKAHGGVPVAVSMLVDRSGGKADFGDVPCTALLHMDVETYQPEGCPLCGQGMPMTKRGSTGK